MTITFYTNFINHHQVPLADCFFKLIGDNYKMVTFTPLPDEFRKRGYEDYSYKEYLIKAYESEQQMKYALELSLSSDIVILGAAPEYLITERIKRNKVTFRYEERIFKKIDRRLCHLTYWKELYEKHTCYRSKKLYMLAASAYKRLDTSLLYSYPDKCYKWGYFIDVPPIDIFSLLEKKDNSCIKVLWCGTISQVKRPDLVVKLASILKEKQINVHINMIGSGAWEDLICNLMNKLDVSDYITLLGNQHNKDVLRLMQEHHIFIFTSDRGEGWGVVLNEAMANGCTVIASNKIGSAPFLIKNKVNGLLFRSGDVRSLYRAVKLLAEQKALRERLAVAAYNTMQNEWSPMCAAENFIQLATALLHNEVPKIIDGPCSKAYIINSKKILE